MGSGASKNHKTPVPRRGSVEYEDADVDPEDYISPDQEVIHSGLLWKLNYGANPNKAEEWLHRKMWLTNSGGLFYYSRQYSEPMGCNIANLSVRAPGKKAVGRFVLEVVGGEDSLHVQPTVLATETVEDRDAWFSSVSSVQQNKNRDELNPLEPLIGYGLHNHRQRLQTRTGESTSREPSPELERAQSLESKLTGVHVGKRPSSHSSYSDRIVENSSHAYHCGILKDLQGGFNDDPCRAKSSGEGGVFRKASKPAPPKRRDSQANFALKSNTMLVLDWDDTIFPTTFVRKDCGLDWRVPIDKQVEPGPGLTDLKNRLEMLSDKVITFLDLACSLANVVIVTLAQRPWVTLSQGNFMPKIQQILDEHAIKIIYAREKIPDSSKRAYYANAFKTPENEADFWMQAKAIAMKQEFESMHSENTKNMISWKNVISIGDSDFERVALVNAVEGYVTRHSEGASMNMTGLTSELISKNGHFMRIRAKTFKMLEEPSCEEMLAQITLLTSWLPHIINKDNGLELELSDSNYDHQLHDIHSTLTGESGEGLSWLTLAGFDSEG